MFAMQYYDKVSKNAFLPSVVVSVPTDVLNATRLSDKLAIFISTSLSYMREKCSHIAP